MPDLTAQTIVLLACVGLFTAISAVIDFKTRRISNKMTVPFFVLGLIYQVAFNGVPGLIDAGQGFLAGFGTLFLLWVVGGGGGAVLAGLSQNGRRVSFFLFVATLRMFVSSLAICAGRAAP